MAVTKQRPVHLDLTKIRLPAVAILSIAHRISGVLLFLSIPFVIYLLQLSLASPMGYAEVQQITGHILFRLLMVVWVWSLGHHLIAGIRFLLIDVDIGVERETARFTAKLVLAIGAVIALLTAIGGLA